MRRITIFTVLVALAVLAGANLFDSNIIQAQATDKTYKIGDLGPSRFATVFYDKGAYSEGWRYLEVSRIDLMKITNDSNGIAWGYSNYPVPGARSAGIGKGKANTKAIVETCNDDGNAAKMCMEYKDYKNGQWFLPSKDELDLIYLNLHKGKKEGERLFRDLVYWSSTEDNA
jgi:hypothetical protein